MVYYCARLICVVCTYHNIIICLAIYFIQIIVFERLLLYYSVMHSHISKPTLLEVPTGRNCHFIIDFGDMLSVFLKLDAQVPIYLHVLHPIWYCKSIHIIITTIHITPTIIMLYFFREFLLLTSNTVHIGTSFAMTLIACSISYISLYVLEYT